MCRTPAVVIIRPDKSEPTASLGLLFAWNYPNKGVLIAEVIEKGPFDNANTKVKAGIVIEKIDGTEIHPKLITIPY